MVVVVVGEVVVREVVAEGARVVVRVVQGQESVARVVVRVVQEQEREAGVVVSREEQQEVVREQGEVLMAWDGSGGFQSLLSPYHCQG